MAKKKVEKAANHERWLLTYADMITLLMIFFIVLWSMSNADSEKFKKISASLSQAFSLGVRQGETSGGQTGQAAFDTRLATFQAIEAQIGAMAEQVQARESVNVALTSEGILVTISGNFLFESGRAEINSETYPVLEALVGELKRLPNEVRISGHTDNVPINTPLYASNWELSSARAVALVRYLNGAGIAARRLSAVGQGEYRPIAPNDTRANRAKNRRAELLIVYPEAPDRSTNVVNTPLFLRPPDVLATRPAATPVSTGPASSPVPAGPAGEAPNQKPSTKPVDAGQERH